MIAQFGKKLGKTKNYICKLSSNVDGDNMILKQYTWATVVKRPNKYFPNEMMYDVYEWDIFKLKWVQLGNSQFGNETYALDIASTHSNKIQRMFDANVTPPVSLVFDENY
jgi:hypothetical protein